MARAFKACSIDGCNRDAHAAGGARGWCPKHYRRWRLNGDPLVSRYDRDQTGHPCKIDGCERPSGHKGLCSLHYQRMRNNGDPAVASRSERHMRIQRWLSDHVDYDGSDCLVWPFSVSDNGRGVATWGGKQISAPRAMCIMAHGEPPTPHHEAAHSCGNGHNGCMNPMHLSWKTHAENEADKLVHGTVIRGADVNTAKLTEDDVLKIRRIGKSMTRKAIAAAFNVAPCTVWEIQTRRSWAWL